MSARLVLERKGQPDETGTFGNVLFTPPIDDDYWSYRVVVGEHQAIVGFPKFATIGIGFAFEEDWKSYLPYLVSTEEIWNHIRHNKGDDNIPDERCIEAIKLVQEAAAHDIAGAPT